MAGFCIEIGSLSYSRKEYDGVIAIYANNSGRPGLFILIIVEGDAWHAAGAYPDRCAEVALPFVAAKRPAES